MLTTGAIGALDESQFARCLRTSAPERPPPPDGVAGVGAVYGLPRVPAFQFASEHIARLAELRAADAASATAHRLAVAGALLSMSTSVPAAALTAGTADANRVRRLIDGPVAISRARAASIMFGAAAVVLVPLLLLAGPAATARGMSHCKHSPSAAALAATAVPGLENSFITKE